MIVISETALQGFAVLHAWPLILRNTAHSCPTISSSYCVKFNYTNWWKKKCIFTEAKQLDSMANSRGGLIVSQSLRNSLLSTAKACLLSFIFPGNEMWTSRQHIYAAGKFIKGIFMASALAFTQCNCKNLISLRSGATAARSTRSNAITINVGVMTFSFRIYDRKSRDLTGNSKGVLLLLWFHMIIITLSLWESAF